jgi:hypothetical protein
LQAKQLIFSDFSFILQNYVVTLLSEKGKVESDKDVYATTEHYFLDISMQAAKLALKSAPKK